MKPLVSIIIPTFNRSDQLINCLESVFQIDYSHYEVIVVNNASSDDTAEVVETRYSERVRLVNLPENTGASGGRNAGMEYAEGKYFCFIDSDNLIEPDFLSKLVQTMEENENAGVVGPLMYFNTNRNAVFFSSADINFKTSQTHYIRRNDYQEKLIEANHIPNLCLVRREAVEKVGVNDPYYHTYYEESDWHNRMILAGYRVLVNLEAVDYHDVPYNMPVVKNRGKYFLYHMAKNRPVFMKRFASRTDFLIFILFYNNLFMFYYVFSCLIHRQFSLIPAYLKGYGKGLINSFRYRKLESGTEDQVRLKLIHREK